MFHLPQHPTRDYPARPSEQSPNDEKLPKPYYEFNITVVGDFDVGKTSLIMRYISNTFDLAQAFTTSVNYYGRFVHRNSSRIKLKIWDTPGRLYELETYSRCLTEADLILLVYDVTNQNSFEELRKLVSYAKVNAPEDVLFFLVGAKCELSNRVVFPAQTENFGLQNRLPTYETSALLNFGIEKLFDDIVDELLRASVNRVVEEDTVRLEQEMQVTSYGRCSTF